MASEYVAQQEQAAAHFNGDAPKNPNIGNISTRAQLDDYAVKKQQYAYAVKMGETLRDYGIKNVVIEDIAEGVNDRWENGTVYVSSKLDTAQAISAKVAHEISHAAKEGDVAFSLSGSKCRTTVPCGASKTGRGLWGES